MSKKSRFVFGVLSCIFVLPHLLLKQNSRLNHTEVLRVKYWAGSFSARPWPNPQRNFSQKSQWTKLKSHIGCLLSYLIYWLKEILHRKWQKSSGSKLDLSRLFLMTLFFIVSKYVKFFPSKFLLITTANANIFVCHHFELLHCLGFGQLLSQTELSWWHLNTWVCMYEKSIIIIECYFWLIIQF